MHTTFDKFFFNFTQFFTILNFIFIGQKLLKKDGFNKLPFLFDRKLILCDNKNSLSTKKFKPKIANQSTKSAKIF